MIINREMSESELKLDSWVASSSEFSFWKGMNLWIGGENIIGRVQLSLLILCELQQVTQSVHLPVLLSVTQNE